MTEEEAVIYVKKIAEISDKINILLSGETIGMGLAAIAISINGIIGERKELTIDYAIDLIRHYNDICEEKDERLN
jgi:hypothetical protein